VTGVQTCALPISTRYKSTYDPAVSDKLIKIMLEEMKPNTVFPDRVTFLKAFDDDDFVKVLIKNLKIVQDNMVLLETSGVVALCNERRAEGDFINQSLTGLQEQIAGIIQNTNQNADPGNVDADKGLLKNIPLVKEPCFKFFCKQDDVSCFTQVNDSQNVSSPELYNDIKDTIKEKIDGLVVSIFCVLNINRRNGSAPNEDPPTIPFVDINGLLEVRNKFLTYKFYNLSEDQKILEEIKSRVYELTGEETLPVSADKKTLDNKVDNPNKKSALEALYRKKDNIGEDLVKGPVDLIKQIINGEGVIFNHLIELIKQLKIINSLSALGTMFFLNEVKNYYTTDQACSMIVDKKIIPDIDIEPIDEYINAMPLNKNKYPSLIANKLGAILYFQKKFMEDSRGDPTNRKLPLKTPDETDTMVSPQLKDKVTKAKDKGFYEPDAYMNDETATATGTGPVTGGSKISNFLGGYLNRLETNDQKMKLANEYRRLKNLYRNMK
jgi:hypothetical protein